MTPEEGTRLLIFHTEMQPGSFVEMLRPYRGLREDVLASVNEALRAVAPSLQKNSLPRDVMSALWAIAHFGRAWALDPEGMLRRNDLIRDEDHQRLWDFLAAFGLAVQLLLDGVEEDVVFR